MSQHLCLWRHNSTFNECHRVACISGWRHMVESIGKKRNAARVLVEKISHIVEIINRSFQLLNGFFPSSLQIFGVIFFEFQKNDGVGDFFVCHDAGTLLYLIFSNHQFIDEILKVHNFNLSPLSRIFKRRPSLSVIVAKGIVFIIHHPELSM